MLELLNSSSNFFLIGEVTSGTAAASQLVEKAYDTVWDIAVNPKNGVYAAVTTYATGILALTVMLWSVNFYSELSEGSPKPIAKNLLVLILVTTMLANSGQGMANFTLGMRDFFRGGNTMVMKAVLLGNDFSKTITSLQGYTTYTDQAKKLAEECYTLSGEARNSCYKENRIKAEALLKSVDLPKEWAISFGNNLNSFFKDPLGTTVDGVKSTVSKTYNNVVNTIYTPIMAVVELLMYFMAAAFQQLVEMSLIVTAMLAPIALAQSVLSPDKPAIIAWFSSFFGVILVRFCLNIITALTATMASTAGPENGTLPAAVIFGLLGPLLAFAMGTGGGMAVFNSLTSLASTGVSFAIGKIK
jgi:hypothetical protein